MIKRNQVLDRNNQKPIVYDTFNKTPNTKKPLVIFCHGYKGFKDWGAWNRVAEQFMTANLFFVKFNFSHNGGTTENPIDFPDLNAFAENNYTKELDDLEAILSYFTQTDTPYSKEIDLNNITVIGHSRGGGIAILKAAENTKITKLITWASVSDFSTRSSTIGNLEQWKKDGVKYVLNGRTHQNMPHNIQFYNDFLDNKERLNIETAEKALSIPHLIIHAENDPSVAFKEARQLHKWNTNSELVPLHNSDHVFGAKHPWEQQALPEAFQTVVSKSIAFIKS
ncbi:alpha/beta hydrolase fold domain-containing protein [Bizionia gelidisalsuginis]|uniref:Alpha/beta hydrolase fold domain-containing protein n=1 Tax=Bizionia gelidisalsuginis TaxID=291188 RepID=A0ABY3MC96_9FLAO|nr:alpha/beta hydrolase fold domain-containing protein [Bizionia gelidisalsuginis]TYC15537.1 alpha/beta hydrolase fold domain-containing protein [Bizionia gelidisalsuginis]